MGWGGFTRMRESCLRWWMDGWRLIVSCSVWRCCGIEQGTMHFCLYDTGILYYDVWFSTSSCGRGEKRG